MCRSSKALSVQSREHRKLAAVPRVDVEFRNRDELCPDFIHIGFIRNVIIHESLDRLHRDRTPVSHDQIWGPGHDSRNAHRTTVAQPAL